MDLTWEAPLLGEVERLLKHPGPRLRGVAPGSTPPVVTLHPVACIGSGADRQRLLGRKGGEKFSYLVTTGCRLIPVSWRSSRQTR